MPLSREAISGLCRLMDQNGDGTIDLREVTLTPLPAHAPPLVPPPPDHYHHPTPPHPYQYAETLLAEGSLSKSISSLVRKHELHHADIGASKTRRGMTPTSHYGGQVRELLQASPASEPLPQP